MDTFYLHNVTAVDATLRDLGDTTCLTLTFEATDCRGHKRRTEIKVFDLQDAIQQVRRALLDAEEKLRAEAEDAAEPAREDAA